MALSRNDGVLFFAAPGRTGATGTSASCTPASRAADSATVQAVYVTPVTERQLP